MPPGGLKLATSGSRPATSSRRKSIRALVALAIAACVLIVPAAIVVRLPPPAALVGEVAYVAITSGAWNDKSPVWSPDGSTIAFVSDRNGGWQVWAMALDASWEKALTPSNMAATDPSWSPDSSRVAFWSQVGSRTDIRIVFVSNSSITTVTSGNYSVLQTQPKWSPDGTQLLFYMSAGNVELVSVSTRTLAVRVIAAVEGNDSSATWVSPNEIYYSTESAGSYEVLSYDLNSGTSSVVLGGDANYTAPLVSLSTSRLVYISDLVPENQHPGRHYYGTYSPGDFNLWVSGLDGTNATFQYGPEPIAVDVRTYFDAPYTPGTIDPSQSLAWSPNGSIVAYIAQNQAVGTSLFLWDVTSWAANQLGPINANSTEPSWSPDSIYLAFAATVGGYYHIFILDTTNGIQPMPIGF